MPERTVSNALAMIEFLMRCASLVLLTISVIAQRPVPFAIEVVDATTNRGVPLVELKTTNHVMFVTDSNGIVAVNEPELSGRSVYFHVRSHGYEYPEDRFGYRGFRCVVKPGVVHVVRLQRINIAERLYRVTGAGIYRDSVLVGSSVPIAEPLINGGVTGQDSVVNVIYRGKLYWFWGDTNRASYPLGNFSVSGATSLMPGDGGLSPSKGVDLTYFVNAKGFSRQMCRIEGPGPVWIFGLMVVIHEGRERLLTHYARIKTLGVRHEHGIAVYDDAKAAFSKLCEFPLALELHPTGNPTRVTEDGGDRFYFPTPYPGARVRATYEAITDPMRYEAFSCFVPGTDRIERQDGKVVWAWKKGAQVVSARRLKSIGSGLRDSWMGLTDVETGEQIIGHGGTVQWNAHRGKWVMIALQTFGRSMLGEVWFAEADTLMGPWGYARRIVTHDKYSFYNVKHHHYFDAEAVLYFEGTYTAMFSGNKVKTPRYDYNQIMYRLDLEDPRLRLPVPIYEVAGEKLPLTGVAVHDRDLWSKVVRVPFWAKPTKDGFELLSSAEAGAETTVVYAWQDGDGKRLLRAKGDGPGSAWRRVETPVGSAWPAPSHEPPLVR